MFVGRDEYLEGIAQGLSLFVSNRPRFRRNQESRAGPRDEIEPLLVAGPRSRCRDRYAVCIQHEKGSMLRQAKSEGVDAHAPRALPLLAAGIIAGALHLKNPCRQVSYGVARDQDGGIPCRLPDLCIKLPNNFGGRPAAIMETPAGQRGLRRHLTT